VILTNHRRGNYLGNDIEKTHRPFVVFISIKNGDRQRVAKIIGNMGVILKLRGVEIARPFLLENY